MGWRSKSYPGRQREVFAMRNSNIQYKWSVCSKWAQFLRPNILWDPTSWASISYGIHSYERAGTTAVCVSWLDAGSRADFTSSRPPPPWTSIFQFSFFCTMRGLEKLGLVDRNLDQNRVDRGCSRYYGVTRFGEPIWHSWSAPLLVESYNVLSRFGSLLVWAADSHHDVTRWPSYLFVTTTSRIDIWWVYGWLFVSP